MITCFILYVHTTHNTMTQKYAGLYKDYDMENFEVLKFNLLQGSPGQNGFFQYHISGTYSVF